MFKRKLTGCQSVGLFYLEGGSRQNDIHERRWSADQTLVTLFTPTTTQQSQTLKGERKQCVHRMN